MSTNIQHYITDEDVININDLVSELAVILRKFEIDLNPYQTDVYFYYDADAKIGRLETFINVGGHSWFNDDHVTIYSDSPNYDDVYDYFNDISEFADALEISENDLIKAVRQFKDFGINFPVDRRNIIGYTCITCDYEPALAALNMSIKDLTENQIKIMQEELHKQIEYYNA